MLLDGLRATPALDFVESPTLESFEASHVLGDARNTPLSGRCGAARAQVVLPSCHLTVQRTFPRVLEMNYRSSGTLCIVPLIPSIDVRINGIAGSGSHVMTVRGEAACEIIEPEANLFAFLNLSPAISERDWPGSADQMRIVEIHNLGALQSFRRTVENLLAFASLQLVPVHDLDMLRSFEEALLSSLDEAMISNVAVPSPRHFERYLRIVRRVDEYLSCRQATSINLPDLARVCDVSIRTLQNAVIAVRGLSVHQYLRRRRLWSVRQSLASGRSIIKISDVARSYGFWHMGEFSAAYRAIFGESPSDTLKAS
jgi:AraC family ethanolamine operon transcriptional activator